MFGCQSERSVCDAQVTFAFKLTAGACPKSYGPSVARAAGIPASIAERAVAVSHQFEEDQSAARCAGGGEAGAAPSDRLGDAAAGERRLLDDLRAAWARLPAA